MPLSTPAAASGRPAGDDRSSLDGRLEAVLKQQGFSGRIESTLEPRLGRQLNPQLAHLGNLLFFDTIGDLHDDNNCSGCHSPTNGFGDSQPMAIGVQSNGVVGPDRAGPRNQRRTPTVVNAAFYPKLMWNGRFSSLSGDPFNNSLGYLFPPPEGTTRFPANDPTYTALLMAQAIMPPTELTEAAGYTGTAGTISPRFDQFDDGKGEAVPPPDASGYRNDPIRNAVVQRLNDSQAYRQLFGAVYPEVAAGAPIDISMFGRAIAEFEFTLVRADAPIDEFARGNTAAMTASEKRGALLFFGKADCVSCHAVAGESNEMFSDFQMHDIAVPQIAPRFGVAKGNVIFDGKMQDDDFGLEQFTGNYGDRCKFRTSPLRNVALQAAYFHDGAYKRLDDAIRHHLDAVASLKSYDPVRAGVPADLTQREGSPDMLLSFLDPKMARPIHLNDREFKDLVSFVRDGLLDPRASTAEFCKKVPDTVPSGMPVLLFQACTHQK